MTEMLNFTVGPVKTAESVLKIGSEQVPYFRTEAFSSIMLENEKLMLEFSKAPPDSRTVFLTGSGTASMEAVVVNLFTPKDRVLIVNGGSFGQRFVDLCRIHEIPFAEIIPPRGDDVTDEQLAAHEGKCYTALLVNIHETSVGVLYDAARLSSFCQRNGLLFVVDAISSFLADSFDMAALGVDAMITGSQKALACPPGISAIVLGPRALNRVAKNDSQCLYLDLKQALADQRRGQTPFTPAVGTLLQMHARLREIAEAGGADVEVCRIAACAADFRAKVADLPLEICSRRLSNALTPLHPQGVSAYDLFLRLQNRHRIWVCPNGGVWRESIFRVGHLGALTALDNDRLIDALKKELK